MSNPVRFAPIATLLGLIACGNSDDAGTSGGNAGQTALGGSAVTQAGSAGAAQGGGGNAGAGNAGAGPGGVAGQPSGGGGGAGSGGANGGSAGANAGGGGAGGATSSPGPTWKCPPGPFPKPMVGQSEQLCMGFNYAHNYLEGPTWVAAESALYFSNFDIFKGTGGDIVKYKMDGQCEVFTTNVGCNGLAVGGTGKLLGACQQSRSVQSFELGTKAATTLASMFMDKMLDTPNDIVVRSNGAVYFTNRTAELDGRPVGYGTGVFWIDAQGTLGLIHKGDDGNGIALSPDERTLYVNNVATWALDENGVPGQQGPKVVSGDGLAVDCAGNLYMNSGQIVDPTGKAVGNFPGGTNMAFGGPDGTILFVVSGGSNVRALHMNLPGIP